MPRTSLSITGALITTATRQWFKRLIWPTRLMRCWLANPLLLQRPQRSAARSRKSINPHDASIKVRAHLRRPVFTALCDGAEGRLRAGRFVKEERKHGRLIIAQA